VQHRHAFNKSGWARLSSVLLTTQRLVPPITRELHKGTPCRKSTSNRYIFNLEISRMPHRPMPRSDGASVTEPLERRMIASRKSQKRSRARITFSGLPSHHQTALRNPQRGQSKGVATRLGTDSAAGAVTLKKYFPPTYRLPAPRPICLA